MYAMFYKHKALSESKQDLIQRNLRLGSAEKHLYFNQKKNSILMYNKRKVIATNFYDEFYIR